VIPNWVTASGLRRWGWLVILMPRAHMTTPPSASLRAETTALARRTRSQQPAKTSGRMRQPGDNRNASRDPPARRRGLASIFRLSVALA